MQESDNCFDSILPLPMPTSDESGSVMGLWKRKQQLAELGMKLKLPSSILKSSRRIGELHCGKQTSGRSCRRCSGRLIPLLGSTDHLWTLQLSSYTLDGGSPYVSRSQQRRQYHQVVYRPTSFPLQRPRQPRQQHQRRQFIKRSLSPLFLSQSQPS